MPVFEKGHPKIGGRVKGTRNRLGTVFLEKLLKEFGAFGEEAIRICRVERPHEFLKIVASILPKEFEINDSRLKEISDDELDLFIELARRQLASGVARKPTAEKNRCLTENRLAYYKPYPKQAEFHNGGATHRERLLMAGNQLGKTLAGGFEVAMHATGRYPDWWQGCRFKRPIVGWACGVTGEVVRDTVQKALTGLPGQEGTGAIPERRHS
jgi:hypothetical protein